MTLLFITEWSNEDVVEKYLKPINMEHMAKAFLENNINGAVLLALEVQLGKLMQLAIKLLCM